MKLKYVRELARVTQIELANMTKLPRWTIQRVEGGIMVLAEEQKRIVSDALLKKMEIMKNELADNYLLLKKEVK